MISFEGLLDYTQTNTSLLASRKLSPQHTRLHQAKSHLPGFFNFGTFFRFSAPPSRLMSSC